MYGSARLVSEELASVSDPVASAPGFLGRGLFGLVPGLLLLAVVATGCGPGVKKTPPPTLAETIRDVRDMAEFACGRMLADPARAAGELAMLKEGLEARSQSCGEPFTTLLATVSEIQAAWSGQPSAAAVKQGVATLRESLARMDER